MGTFTNSEDLDEMPHIVAFHQGLHSSVFVKVKKIFRQNNTIFYENYNLTPLDMYNRLSKVYGIIQEGKMH